ncbi:MAG: hypothetical protein LUD29_05610 [Clostridia bacterium]|nr:hypothetical protein [Clostridia bacterium]
MNDKTCTHRSRNNCVHVMLSDEEYEKFRALVEKSGLTIREFVTRAILSKQIIVFDGWHNLIYQLTRLGSNYDQTLTKVYMDKATAKELKDVSDDIKDVIELIRDTMEGQIENANFHSKKQQGNSGRRD